ncbi:MAG: hypothetical protein WD342_14350 [Verrucomicrobiales bacterium]
MEIDPSITLNPIASTPHLVLLFALLACFAAWAGWKGTARAGVRVRLTSLLCRGTLLLGLLVLALNPGKWIERREDTRSFWTILADRSRSMSTRDAADGKSRWEASRKWIASAIDAADSEDRVEIAFFDTRLDAKASGTEPEGGGTDLVASVDSLLSLAKNRSDRFKGAIVLTDGRQTAEHPDFARVALRARASEAPFYILPIGGEVKPVDLSVEPARRQFVAFAGQECTVTAKVRAQGLGAIRPELALASPDGEEIETVRVELAEGEEKEVRFTFPAPAPGVHLFQFRTEQWPKERVSANNEAVFTLTVLDGETKIFMVEGSPYWDSKFLSQTIRNQENMQITSVYRLSSDRFFRVETGGSALAQETANVFPESAEELGEYDLVVIGKGADNFLDENRLALLSEFVRDRGGAVFFTRSKPYRGAFPGIEFLEPVTWGERITQPFRLEPTAAGEAAGLFGDLLPGRADPVWGELPSLQESYRCLDLKPFTEVLVNGALSLDGREQTVPVLMSRRFGNGMVLLLNADGLWQWDFFPSDKGVEGQYEEFWSQLIQWAITFSEFLPGQNLSLHLDESIVRPGSPVLARVGYRGEIDTGNPPRPILKILDGDREIRTVPAVRPTDRSSRWEAALTLAEPGSYRVQALDPADPDTPGPSVPLTILPPPGETEELSADPDFLREFSETTGGRLIDEAEFPEIVAELDRPETSVNRSKAVWEPLWDQWWSMGILLSIASLEWFTRRRSGLL